MVEVQRDLGVPRFRSLRASRVFHGGQVQTTAANYWDKMKIKSAFALADKSDNIVDIFGTTSMNRACAWRFGEWIGLLCFGK